MALTRAEIIDAATATTPGAAALAALREADWAAAADTEVDVQLWASMANTLALLAVADQLNQIRLSLFHDAIPIHVYPTTQP